jgi:hypothetical protein
LIPSRLQRRTPPVVAAAVAAVVDVAAVAGVAAAVAGVAAVGWAETPSVTVGCPAEVVGADVVVAGEQAARSILAIAKRLIHFIQGVLLVSIALLLKWYDQSL